MLTCLRFGTQITTYDKQKSHREFRSLPGKNKKPKKRSRGAIGEVVSIVYDSSKYERMGLRIYQDIVVFVGR